MPPSPFLTAHQAAHALGMDSGDGTVLARDPSRLARVVRGLAALNAQMSLEAI